MKICLTYIVNVSPMSHHITEKVVQVKSNCIKGLQFLFIACLTCLTYFKEFYKQKV